MCETLTILLSRVNSDENKANTEIRTEPTTNAEKKKPASDLFHLNLNCCCTCTCPVSLTFKSFSVVAN